MEQAKEATKDQQRGVGRVQEGRVTIATTVAGETGVVQLLPRVTGWCVCMCECVCVVCMWCVCVVCV